VDSDTYLIDRLRLLAQGLRTHADMRATSRWDALWRILNARKAKHLDEQCRVELRYVADQLTRAADRLEVLTHRDGRSTTAE